ncbi:MAG: hypothetical protein V3V97_16420 [Hyphomicrobiaceae bacterium]
MKRSFFHRGTAASRSNAQGARNLGRQGSFARLAQPFTLAAALTTGIAVSGTEAFAARDNDYPTIAIADYVFGCMATNGQSRQALERCSCSIDVIASLLTYEQYVAAETVMRLRLVGGEKTTIFRTGKGAKEAFARLKRAQAEAEIRCF